MGSSPSHEQLAYESRTGDGGSETEHRGSLRLLTRPRTRQDAIRKLTRGRVLVLGLDGAGKSTLVNHLTRQADGDPTALPLETTLYDELARRPLPSYLSPDPTSTRQSANWRLEGGERYLQLLDVSGRRANRGKWYASAVDTSTASPPGGAAALPVLGVVFVVDAADGRRFPVVATELVRFLKMQTRHKQLRHSRFFLLLNKADRFLPAVSAPVDEPELDEDAARDTKTQQQQQLGVNQQRQRAAMREVRRELRRCVDYELLADQRRHPAHYRAASSSLSVATASTAPCAKSTAMASLLFASTGSAPAPVAGEATRKGATVPTRPSASALLSTSMDCSALDRASVRAVRLWLHEELNKSP